MCALLCDVAPDDVPDTATDAPYGAPPAIAVEPVGTPEWLADAVRSGGGRVVDIEDAEALLWASPNDPDGLASVLAAHGDHLRWVQLPWAGVEPYADVLDHDRLWTCGKGVYAEPVAEMALTLSLASLRCIDRYARATQWRADGAIGTNLTGARVVVLGGGAITESFLRLISPFGCRCTIVRRRPDQPLAVPASAANQTSSPNRTDQADGAPVEVLGFDQLDDAVAGADLVVLALALTPATAGIVDARLLELMGPQCHLVNVARGAHVVTDDLVAALSSGTIAGAAIDVADPEPVPDGHPMWALPNCIVTPHVANTPRMAKPLLAARIVENVSRWHRGEPLVGPIDVDAGY